MNCHHRRIERAAERPPHAEEQSNGLQRYLRSRPTHDRDVAQVLHYATDTPTGTSALSECSHIGHSNVRRSSPGASGIMRASIISVPHLGHSGRTIGADDRGGAYTGISPHSAAPLRILHRDRKEAAH
jgi:hypothetical protein